MQRPAECPGKPVGSVLHRRGRRTLVRSERRNHRSSVGFIAGRATCDRGVARPKTWRQPFRSRLGGGPRKTLVATARSKGILVPAELLARCEGLHAGV